ncbi:hypothetical protein E2C01_030119 [Portunus trituberculatus]|uniref:Uncharacterized protein n=1 Tax=Portunus trituberculatus TaxID=210409 RepID=A0A5B7ER90_PORTR|nr:hypothetical protein [Portunus trituberculatus]
MYSPSASIPAVQEVDDEQDGKNEKHYVHYETENHFGDLESPPGANADKAGIDDTGAGDVEREGRSGPGVWDGGRTVEGWSGAMSTGHWRRSGVAARRRGFETLPE